MIATLPDTEAVLTCAAEYRAIGCRWPVVASHLECDDDLLEELVNEAGDAFEKMVQWFADDREEARTRFVS